MTKLTRPICNVLIIDDDPIQREILTAYFEGRGAQRIHQNADGLKAKKWLQENSAPVDVILVDLNMPDFDGVEFISFLHDIKCRVPVLIVSGAEKSIFVAAEALARRYDIQLLGALTKPVDFSKLGQLLPPCS